MKKFKWSFFLLCLFSTPVLNAQIISNEAFIQGNYVEVGVNSFGEYGTASPAPAAYHPKLDGSSSRNLGFVADPDQDGWGVGTPNYFGDFFFPGTPQEGFSVQLDGAVFHNWNLGVNEISGNNTSLTTVGANKVAVWEGSINGLNIKQKTIVPQNQLFFVVRVDLTNTTSTTMSNVYYMRTLDPDNDVTLSSVYKTENEIVFTLPNANNNTLVSAKGLTYTNCYLGLGTKDCRAKSFILNSGLSPYSSQLIDEFHNQTAGNGIYSGINIDDVGIGITFGIGDIPPGETRKIAYTYILRQSDLEVALSQTLPEVSLNAAPILDGSSFNLCENQAINLSVQNGEGYVWHWEPESYFATPYGETNVLTVPNSTVNFTVSGQSDCSPFSLNFSITPSTFQSTLKEINHVLCSGSSTSYDPLAGVSPVTSTVKWYDAAVGGTQIGSASLFTTPILTNATSTPVEYIYYYEETTVSSCISERIPFKVVVYNSLNLPDKELKKCVVGSTTTSFNLHDFEEELYDNPTYIYYASLSDYNNNIPIADPSNYTNTTNNQIIYVKVIVNASCFDTLELTLRVFEQFVLTPQVIRGCDDDFDNKLVFDLRAKNALITSLPGTSFSYFLTHANAVDNVNEILDFANYTNLTNPQVIYVRAYNANCFEVTTLTLEVFNKTVVAPTVIDSCEENISGSANFNLAENNSLISPDAGLIFSYYTSLVNLSNDVPIANFSNFENTSNPQTIYVKVVNPAGCTSFTEITLNVLPVTRLTISDEFKCDDSFDGFVAFDFSTKNPEIIAALPSDTYTYTYYKTEADALLQTNPIPQIYTNTTSPEAIYVRAKGLNGCPYIINFNIIVLVKPVLTVVKNRRICETKSITLDAGPGFDNYLWSTGETTQTIVITTPGIYTIKVSNSYGTKSCETTDTINVVLSNVATITNIAPIDFTYNENSLHVFVTGAGDYEYSLDDLNYQDSPYFYGLYSGIYTVYVRDKNGCGVVNEEVYLLMYPKFFTPNGDGHNDYWNVKYSSYEPNLKVTIFDRFGKLLKAFTGADKGWDGTYIGNMAPADDFWFLVKREDGKEFRGQFSLKR